MAARINCCFCVTTHLVNIWAMFKWAYLATYLILTNFSHFIHTTFLFACFPITSTQTYMHKGANMNA
jgi:hypothetical protein